MYYRCISIPIFPVKLSLRLLIMPVIFVDDTRKSGHAKDIIVNSKDFFY